MADRARNPDGDVVAVVCSDVHLSHKPPVARSAEPDWYAAMHRPLKKLQEICKKHWCPLLIAGDVFDRWNSPPELINFAIEVFGEFPAVYAIPGQHDLPNHDLEQIHRSAYWSLVAAKVVQNVCHSEPIGIGPSVRVFGVPWECSIDEPELVTRGQISVAIVHSYIWIEGKSYPGADENKVASSYLKSLQNYDAAFFGDNHKGFVVKSTDRCQIMNCGGLMRRKIDEVDYQPHVGLLMADGSIRVHYLDTSQDKFLAESDLADIEYLDSVDIDSEEFLKALQSTGQDSLDFRGAVDRVLDVGKYPSRVRELVLEDLGQDILG